MKKIRIKCNRRINLGGIISKKRFQAPSESRTLPPVGQDFQKISFFFCLTPSESRTLPPAGQDFHAAPPPTKIHWGGGGGVKEFEII